EVVVVTVIDIVRLGGALDPVPELLAIRAHVHFGGAGDPTDQPKVARLLTDQEGIQARALSTLLGINEYLPALQPLNLGRISVQVLDQLLGRGPIEPDLAIPGAALVAQVRPVVAAGREQERQADGDADVPHGSPLPLSAPGRITPSRGP